MVILYLVLIQIYLFSVESRATTPQFFERLDKQNDIVQDTKEETTVSTSPKKEIPEKQSEENLQTSSKTESETESKECVNTDASLKPKGSEKSVKIKEKKKSEVGTNVSVSSLNTESEPPAVQSQKSKLTGKTRTGWI